MDSLYENITLLRMINSFPGPRTANGHSAEIFLSKALRSSPLKFEHEKEIAQYFSFISAYSDSAKAVLALCLEAVNSPNRLVIRWAANDGKHSVYIEGLKKIAVVLVKEAKCPKHQNHLEEMIAAVTNLNKKRILARLRSKHAVRSRKTKDKPLISKVLLCGFQMHSERNPAMKVPAQLLSTVENVAKQIDTLESLSLSDARSEIFQELIISILWSVYRLHKHYNIMLRDILYRIPTSTEWSNNSSVSLLIALSKLAHYITASKGLLRAARRYDYFQHIKIEHADVGAHTNIRNPNLTASKGLWSLYKCQKSNSKMDNGMSSAIRVYERRITAPKLEEQLESSMHSGKRLHAELQLILFYEGRGNQAGWPRVICATKSACYLCNLFIHYHGMFVTPSNHAKIYDTWAVPNVPYPGLFPKRNAYLQNVLVQLSKAVEKRLLDSIQNKSIAPFYHNESTVRLDASAFTPSQVSLTSEMLQSVESDAPQNTNKSTLQESNEPSLAFPGTSETVSTSNTESVARDKSLKAPAKTSASDVRKEALPNISSPSKPNDHALDSPATNNLPDDESLPSPDPVYLDYGIPFQCTLTHLSPLRIHTPKIHLHITQSLFVHRYTTRSNVPKAQMLHLQVEWLTEDILQTTNMKDAVDLSQDWQEKAAAAGAALTFPGLLVRKEQHVVAIRVLNRQSSQ